MADGEEPKNQAFRNLLLLNSAVKAGISVGFAVAGPVGAAAAVAIGVAALAHQIASTDPQQL